jgi:malonyl-CoA O-methyltransferase
MIKRAIRRLLPLSVYEEGAGGRGLKTLSSLDAYDQWAAAYPPHAHNALMEAEESAMKSLFPPLSGQVVLDLACGTGRYGLLARDSGAKTIVGLDNSPAMLRANALPYRALAATEAIPLASRSVDVILCGLALGHLPRLELSLTEIARILKPGGCALVSDFHPFMFLSGRRRTFTAPDGKTYAVEHYPHLYADYHRAASDAGLRIESVLEPRYNNAPVVIVYRFIKV